MSLYVKTHCIKKRERKKETSAYINRDLGSKQQEALRILIITCWKIKPTARCDGRPATLYGLRQNTHHYIYRCQWSTKWVVVVVSDVWRAVIGWLVPSVPHTSHLHHRLTLINEWTGCVVIMARVMMTLVVVVVVMIAWVIVTMVMTTRDGLFAWWWQWWWY